MIYYKRYIFIIGIIIISLLILNPSRTDDTGITDTEHTSGEPIIHSSPTDTTAPTGCTPVSFSNLKYPEAKIKYHTYINCLFDKSVERLEKGAIELSDKINSGKTVSQTEINKLFKDTILIDKTNEEYEGLAITALTAYESYVIYLDTLLLDTFKVKQDIKNMLLQNPKKYVDLKDKEKILLQNISNNKGEDTYAKLIETQTYLELYNILGINLEGLPTSYNASFASDSIYLELLKEKTKASRSLDIALNAYNELRTTYPLHLRYVQIIKDLENYRDQISRLRTLVDCTPTRFKKPRTSKE